MTAVAQQPPLKFWPPRLDSLARLPKSALVAAVALLIALVAVSLLWSRGPEYRVLFANLEEADGGAIVAALGQMNIPYQFSEGGGALLVPADKVHETRLALATRGLPKGGAVGFELMDNARFGASQFAEQVTYQRGLEGELARSIEALQAVQRARVHLALPRQSLFVRERQKPSASVLLNLHPGRSLGDSQVAAIAWLVSSSVPDLAAEDISIVDQNGRLLSAGGSGALGLDGDQQRRLREIEQRAVERILSLVSPIVGSGNVQAQVSADLDFAQREETSEVYRPNQAPDQAAIRSRQTSASSQTGQLAATGVPGALTNQPPAQPTAPIVQPPANAAPGQQAQQGQQAQAQAQTQAQAPGQSRHDDTVNYELDRTISHVRLPTGTVRRLSVAVLLNYRADASGAPQPLPAEDIAKIEKLVREAVGYSEARGDTLSVANSPFAETPVETVPLWRDPASIDLAKSLLQYLAIGLIVLLAWRLVARPILRQRAAEREAAIQAAESASTAQQDHAERALREAQRTQEKRTYENNLATARELAQKDPRAVAMIVRSWMSDGNDTH
ncbi:MAG: flagellar basal-body MS-ring/collar protein FliF [Comamonas sp.]